MYPEKTAQILKTFVSLIHRKSHDVIVHVISVIEDFIDDNVGDLGDLEESESSEDESEAECKSTDTYSVQPGMTYGIS